MKLAPRVFFITKSLEFSLVLRISHMRKGAKRCKQKFSTTFAVQKDDRKDRFHAFLKVFNVFLIVNVSDN